MIVLLLLLAQLAEANRAANSSRNKDILDTIIGVAAALYQLLMAAAPLSSNL